MRPPRFSRRLLGDQRGAVAVEYGLILALIFLALAGSVASLGGETGGMWSYLSDKVVGAGAS